MNHPQSCVSVHTTNPTFREPTFQQSPMSFIKYHVAKMTKASMASLSFGYMPYEIQDAGAQASMSQSTKESKKSPKGPLGPTMSRLFSHRPQTLAFSLCDSPVGLLAGLLDVIHTQAPPPLEPVTSRSRSPFLSPIELEQQESHHDRTSVETAFRTGTATATGEIANREKEEAGMKVYSWSATEVLNWTMMQWLPGSVRNRFTTTPTPTYVLLCIPSAVHGFLENNYPILGSC